MNSRSRFDVIGLLGPLRRYAMVLTRDETEAEDLVHDALVRAYERHHTFRSSGSLRTWLFSVLHNRFVDAQRRKTAEAARVRHMAGAIETIAPADQESSVRLQQVRQRSSTCRRNSGPPFTSSPLRASPTKTRRAHLGFRSAR